MSCYLHANAESTNQCESCGVNLCDDCSTRFEELKCANCMKKAIMARRIRYGIGLAVAIIVWLAIFYGTMPHKPNEYATMIPTIAALFAFSLAHGLNDYYSAIKNPTTQKFSNQISQIFKKGIASSKGEQLLGAIGGIMGTIAIVVPFYLASMICIILIHIMGSFFRRTFLFIKEFNINTSL